MLGAAAARFLVLQAGWTPLHVATHNGKENCVTALLDAGADCTLQTKARLYKLAHVACLRSVIGAFW